MYKDRIVELRRVRAGDLVPAPLNWRKHPKAQQDAMKGILDEIGYADAVLARETPRGLELIDGHLRTSLDDDQVLPVLILDLNDEEAKKMLLTFDPLAAMAETDDVALAALLADVTFSDEAITAMLDSLSSGDFEPLTATFPPDAFPSDEEDQDTTGDAVDEVEADDYVPIAKRGQVWALGDHRLMCGDATSAEDVALVMDGAKADVVWTDPPYGINYQAMRRPDKIENDATMPGATAVVRDALQHAEALCYFVCCDWRSLSFMSKAMEDNGVVPKSCIVWDKGHRVQNLDRYGKQYELMLYAGPFGGEPTQAGDVWLHPRDFTPDHPTPKPVSLIEQSFITSNAQVVYDPFCGSGTTIIAAEKLGRRCYAMELQPKYVDVCIKRWEAFTGRQAEVIA